MDNTILNFPKSKFYKNITICEGNILDQCKNQYLLINCSCFGINPKGILSEIF